MTNIKTKFHTYRFDVSTPDGRSGWKELSDRLKAQDYPHKHGPVICENMGEFYEDGEVIELETKHLFDNQWNTAPDATHAKGCRVFDWKEGAIYSHGRRTSIIFGHYLDQTAEMREVRRNTNCCGYCGHQEPAAKGAVFCDQCLDSEYLQEKDLHLLRMLAVEDSGVRSVRPPLTEGEREHLLPRYRDAQIHGTTERGKARIARERGRVAAEYDKAIRAATVKRDGLTWLMDHGVSTANVIYYDHTSRFEFGWRQPYGEETLAALLSCINEFPFPYTIRCADGRKLDNP